jgi:hypothetical protein
MPAAAAAGVAGGPPPLGPEPDEAADGEIWTPTSRTAVLPLLSAATMWITSVPDCSVSVRCARTVFTTASGPDKVSDGPLADPITVPLKSAMPACRSSMSTTLKTA